MGLITTTTFGQTQVANSDFETWENVGGSDEEPVQWNSFVTANCTLTLGCSTAKSSHLQKSTTAHSGTYSARIWSTSVLGTTANGNMTLGQVQIGSTTATNAANHNKTVRSNSKFNSPFTGKPDSLVVWVKFTPVTATDEARISATIHDDYDYRDPEDANATPHAVGKAELNYGKTNGWKRLSIPFVYSGPSTTAKYILITFTTNKTPGGGKANDEVLIDDLEMIYVPKFAQVPAICTGGTFTLPTTSTNGITGTWSPAVDNTTTTTYTFTPDAGQHASATTMTVTVNNTLTTPTFTPVPAICNGDALALPTTSTNSITGAWSPAVDNTTTTTYTFTPDAGQCANTTTMSVTVNQKTTPAFTQIPAICNGDALALPTTSTNSITGTWSPAVDNTTTTTYTFTPAAGQCANTTTMSVTVNQKTTPVFTQVGPFNSGDSFTLPTTSTNSITGTWSPAVNNTATTTYTFTPAAGQCANTATMTVDINPVGLAVNTLSDIKVFGVNKSVNVDLSSSSVQDATIQIMDLSGKLIVNKKLNDNQLNVIDLNVQEGVYLVSIKGNGKSYTGKIFLQ
jgi:hypothetical protein